MFSATPTCPLSANVESSDKPKGFFVRKDFEVLMPYQKKWITDTSRIKICEKSRRVGITWATQCEMVLLAGSQKSAGGMNCRYVNKKKEEAKEFIEGATKWAERLEVAATLMKVRLGKDGEFLKQELRFASGFKIIAMSSNPKNVRGGDGYLVVDEAAYHDDLEAFFTAGKAYAMWGGRLAFISTHNGAGNPFNQAIEEAKAGKNDYSIHRIDIHKAVKQGLYKRICQVQGTPWAKEREEIWLEDLFRFYGHASGQELEVIPQREGSCFIPDAIVDAALCSDYSVHRFYQSVEFAAQDRAQRKIEVEIWCVTELLPVLNRLKADMFEKYVGTDYARMPDSDVSVIALGSLDRSIRLNVHMVVEMRGVPGSEQTQVLDFILERLVNFKAAAMDTAGAGIEVADRASDRWKSKIYRVGMSEAKGGVGGWASVWPKALPAYREALQNRTVRLPRDLDVRNDHRMFTIKKGMPGLPDGSVKGSDGKPRHGDAAVACMLCNFAVSLGSRDSSKWLLNLVSKKEPSAGRAEINPPSSH